MAKSTQLSDMVAESARTNHVRVLCFALVSFLPLVLVWMSMRSLAAIALSNDTYSHIPWIPVVGFFLIYSERQRLFSEASSGWRIGSPFVVAGVACVVLGELTSWTATVEYRLSVEMLSVVLAWAGVFALFFGANALRAARFPFLVLAFMIPIPEPLLSRTRRNFSAICSRSEQNEFRQDRQSRAVLKCFTRPEDLSRVHVGQFRRD